jgi:hypothetical protein
MLFFEDVAKTSLTPRPSYRRPRAEKDFSAKFLPRSIPHPGRVEGVEKRTIRLMASSRLAAATSAADRMRP